MQFIKPGININFIGNRKIAFCISGALILLMIISLVVKNGHRYGIDFAGGVQIQVKFSSEVDIDAVKKGLVEVNIAKSSVQLFGDPGDNEYLISASATLMENDDISHRIKEALRASTGATAEIRRVEMVGPQVGKDLREKALFAMFYALLFITIYISGRFESKWGKSALMAAGLIAAVLIINKIHVSIPILITVALIVTLVLFWVLKLKYAMGAIVALVHDVAITVGIFSVFNKEFSLPIIAALLTIIGYSLNDTIIVFDRIRENMKKNRKDALEELINRSINETLNRTVLTSVTTLAVVVTLFLFGGGIINDFSFAMIIGVVIGTYSSIFVASPILLTWQRFEKRL